MNTAGINAPGSLVLPPILSILRASALLSESLGEAHLYINYISISTEISLPRAGSGCRYTERQHSFSLRDAKPCLAQGLEGLYAGAVVTAAGFPVVRSPLLRALSPRAGDRGGDPARLPS